MKNTAMVGLVGLTLLTSGCEILAPNVSKANTEKNQLAIAEKQFNVDQARLEIEKEQLDQLKRIADSLELISNTNTTAD